MAEVDRESSAVLGQTMGDMGDTDDEGAAQQHQQGQERVREQQDKEPEAFDAATVTEAKLREILSRLEAALEEENRAGAAIEKLASEAWAKEAAKANKYF